MNPRVVRDRKGLLAMLRHQVASHPDQAEQINPMIARIEADPHIADSFLKQLIKSEEPSPAGTEPGYFNLQALSTLPFLAVTQVEEQMSSLLRRVKIYGEKIGDVRITVTPEDEVFAKAASRQCKVSLGLVNVVYCICLYLLSLKKGMSQSEDDGVLTSLIPEHRANFLHFLDLQIKSEIANEFVTGNFRCDSYLPFVESNEVLEKLGVECKTVDACLKSEDSTGILLAHLLAILCVRFIVLHELAHHHYGHSQLLEIWQKSPEIAEVLLKTGFPSPEARRAMESYADIWATEMLIVTEVYSDSSVLNKELVACPIAPLTRAKLALGAVEITFAIFSAVESVTSDTNASWGDLVSTLNGKIDTMYPGAASRAAFAIAHGTKNAVANHPYLRWTRWWAMKKDIAKIDTRGAGLAIFQLWHACALGGGLLPVKRGTYEYFPKIESEKNTKNSDKDGRETWYMWDRFDYVKVHDELWSDLSRAKEWAAGKL